MTVILAKVLGYCMGVRRAVNSACTALEKNKNSRVYTLGPLIHNQSVLDYLASKGLKILEENSYASVEQGSTVIIRAHGVPPKTIDFLKTKKCTIIDATCPRVVASQKSAAYYSSLNYTVILAGDKNHGEVTGIAGYAGKNFILVENCEDAKNLKKANQNEKAVLLSQTTFSRTEFQAISDIISKKYKNLKVMNTLCPAAKERQDALLNLCPAVDGILVVGGKNSANTRRLLQTAYNNCKNSVLVECAEEIPQIFLKMKRVGITAGASTPDTVIEEVRNRLISNA